MKRNILLGLSLLLLGACELETPPESDLTYAGFWNKEAQLLLTMLAR